MQHKAVALVTQQGSGDQGRDSLKRFSSFVASSSAFGGHMLVDVNSLHLQGVHAREWLVPHAACLHAYRMPRLRARKEGCTVCGVGMPGVC